MLTDERFNAMRTELKGRCPECGRDLTAVDPYAHALDHYPERIPYPEQNAQAYERQQYLLRLAGK